MLKQMDITGDDDMMKKSIIWLALSLVLACVAQAESWNLTTAVGEGISNPIGQWEFLNASNPQDWGTIIDTDPSAYTLFTNMDWNENSERIMWYYTAGDVWSTPSVRIYDYFTDALRSVRMMSSDDRDSIIKWTSPVNGKIQIEGSVLDMDTCSGTGVLRISQYEGSDSDLIVLDEVTITDNATTADTFVLETWVSVGEVIFFRKTFYKWDSYGCCVSDLDVTISTVSVVDPSDEIPDPPDSVLSSGVAMRSNLFWIGMDGNYACSEFGEEGIDAICESISDVAVIAVAAKPESLTSLSYFSDNNIPTLIQNFGNGYLDYFEANSAFEIDWKGVDQGVASSSYPLRGTAHATAITAGATEYAFSKVIESSIKSGFTGFGFQDMVWMWDGERGRSGYHSETMAAFRNALNGLDGGIEIQFGSDASGVYQFADYAEHYLGGMPEPSQLGISSWDEFPFDYTTWSSSTTDQQTRHDLLFDLLTHYQWLRYADSLGTTANTYGGFFQNLTNPEYFANGVDHLFASSLKNIDAVTVEYFGSPRFLDGAYYHSGYLADRKSESIQVGVVMEQGSGGNGDTYWEAETAYATAYELTASTQADHFEADFWPGTQAEISYLLTDTQNQTRIQTLMGFGLGYQHACADQVTRWPTDFVSISTRSLFRVRYSGWHPWEWYLDQEQSPEALLAEEGYIFDGRGEEGLYTMDLPQSVVVYSPTVPSQKGWEYLEGLLNSGDAGCVISAVPNLLYMVTDDLNCVSFSSIDSSIDFGTTSNSSGTLSWADSSIPTTGDSYTVQETQYSIESGSGFVPVAWVGSEAVVACKTYSGGNFMVLLFDPTASGNEALAAAVYEGLLNQEAIYSQWQSLSGDAMVRLYTDEEASMIVVGVHNLQAREVKNDSSQWPYSTSGITTQVKVNTGTAGCAYNYVVLPSGVSGTVNADAYGYVTLSFQDTGHEIFYLLPDSEDQTPLTNIAARKTDLENGLLLNGRIKAGDDSDVTITCTTGGDAVSYDDITMSAVDALQGCVATLTDGYETISAYQGDVSSLTDATTKTTGTSFLLATDSTSTYFTWDLGGTEEEIFVRQLNSVTIWTVGADIDRIGFKGMLYTSVDGVIYTPLMCDVYDAACFDATSSNDLSGAYKVQFEFTSGAVTNFRYLRLLSLNGGGGIRQPRYMEIDADITNVMANTDSDVTITRTTGGDAISIGNITMSAVDALQGCVATLTDGYEVISAYQGAVSSLTDATAATTPTDYLLATDWTSVYFTWDLGGTEAEISARQLDSVTIWTVGSDIDRIGFKGMLYTSVDGIIYTPLMSESYNAACFDATSSNDLSGAYKVQFDFTSGSVTNFRYLRLLSDNGGAEIRQPRYYEIDAEISD
jgi:hypothetical protein